jgi:DNA-binding FadR family transcriptional regulator
MPLEPDNSFAALDLLRDMFRAGRWEHGARLPPERDLAEELGVSRRALRRAMEALEAEGIVWRQQGSGTFAGSRPAPPAGHLDSLLATTDSLQVMEARLRLEPQLAQLAALRASVEDIRLMTVLVGRISECTDADGRELWDGALHRRIAQAAGNALLLAMFDLLNHSRQDPAWRTLREQARTIARSRPVTHDQHLMVIEAIAARDPARAGEAMRRHLLTVQENILRATLPETEPERSST